MGIKKANNKPEFDVVGLSILTFAYTFFYRRRRSRRRFRCCCCCVPSNLIFFQPLISSDFSIATAVE